ncbi:DUF559 domain-containing protein [Dietzia kunjamensis]|uniref:endonuclease domain-containing protein n=1 Tax=Dietzia kunjamensis TaxID=322509 RepID=UPI002DB7B659|nr:DUF559 domain-containing protein [Dietzia kunjamensis]MEB8325848.1 DUF559 domain-containing protein [Dietzia kunjamensis]
MISAMTGFNDDTHPVLELARLSHEIAHIPRRRRERDYVKIADELWLPAHVGRDFETLSVAYSRLYPKGVLTGWSAAVLHGVSPPEDVVPELTIGRRGRARDGLRLRRYPLPDRAVATIRGVPATTLRWTVFDIARFSSHVDGVLAVEKFYQRGLARAAMEETVAYMAGVWGVARVRRVLADADPRTESPRETETRLLLKAAGYTEFIPQVEVPELGYRLDLADPVHKIAVEYDGPHHDDPVQQSKDRRRRNRLQAAGWIVIVVDRRLFRHQRGDILDQVEAAYRLRRFAA